MIVIPNLDQTLMHQIEINRTNPAQDQIEIIALNTTVKKLDNRFRQNHFIVKSVALHKPAPLSAPAHHDFRLDTYG
jgi:hypothetical protein